MIESAMRFPMDPVVLRYAEDWELELEEAREHERELKRYLALCALAPGVIYGMSGQVDELWHTFILFTRKYADFCDQVAGRFLHHYPVAPGDEYPEEKWERDYRRFLADYEATFGEAPPEHIWPPLESSEAEPAIAGS